MLASAHTWLTTVFFRRSILRWALPLLMCLGLAVPKANATYTLWGDNGYATLYLEIYADQNGTYPVGTSISMYIDNQTPWGQQWHYFGWYYRTWLGSRGDGATVTSSPWFMGYGIQGTSGQIYGNMTLRFDQAGYYNIAFNNNIQPQYYETHALSMNLTIAAPAVPPTASLTAPANGSIYYINSTVSLSATASDSTGTMANHNLDIQWPDGVWNFQGRAPPGGSGTWAGSPSGGGSSSSRSVSFTPNVRGTWHARTYANNSAGNTWAPSPEGIYFNVVNTPTTSISASATSIEFGQTTTVTGNYAVDTGMGDSLVYTILASNGYVLPSGGSQGGPGWGGAGYSYYFGWFGDARNPNANTVRPTAVGTITFYPAMYSGMQQSWTNWSNASVAVTVNKATPAISGWANQARTGTGTFPSAFSTSISNPHSGAVTAPTGGASYAVVGASGGGASPTSGAVGAGTSFTPGTYTVRATYGGDSNYSSRTWDVTFTVDNVLPYMQTFAASPSTIIFGQTARVTTNATDSDGNLVFHGILHLNQSGGDWNRGAMTDHSMGWWGNHPVGSDIYAASYSSGAASGASDTKWIDIRPVWTGTHTFHTNAHDYVNWASGRGDWGSQAGYAYLTVSAATPTIGNWSSGSRTPQSGLSYTIQASDLAATFTNPYSGAVPAPSGAKTYTIVSSTHYSSGAAGPGAGTTLTAGSVLAANYTYIIRASVAADGNYNANSADVSWTINNAPPVNVSITTDKATYGFGEAISVTTRSTDTNGDLINHHLVVATASHTTNGWEGNSPSGAKWQHYQTSSFPASADRTRLFSPLNDINYGKLRNLPPGSYALTLNSQDSLPNYHYNPNSVMASFTIVKATPSITGWTNQSRTGTGTFPSAFTAAVSNPYVGTVTAPTGGVSYSVVAASGTGASPTSGAVSAATTFLPGTYTVRAYYAGDTLYNTNSADVTFTVNNQTPTVSLTVNGVVDAGGGAEAASSVTNGSVVAFSSTGSDPDGALSATTVWMLTNASGNQNKLRNSSFDSGSGQSGFVIYDNSSQVNSVTYTTGRSGYGNALTIGWPGNNTTSKGVYFANTGGINNASLFTTGRWYIVSWYAKATGTTAGGGVPMQMAWNQGPSSSTALANPALSTSWQRYAFKIYWAAGPVDVNGFITIAYGVPTAGTLSIDDIMIEDVTASDRNTASAYNANATEWQVLAVGNPTAATSTLLDAVGSYAFHSRSRDSTSTESATAVVNVTTSGRAPSKPTITVNGTSTFTDGAVSSGPAISINYGQSFSMASTVTDADSDGSSFYFIHDGGNNLAWRAATAGSPLTLDAAGWSSVTPSNVFGSSGSFSATFTPPGVPTQGFYRIGARAYDGAGLYAENYAGITVAKTTPTINGVNNRTLAAPYTVLAADVTANSTNPYNAAVAQASLPFYRWNGTAWVALPAGYVFSPGSHQILADSSGTGNYNYASKQVTWTVNKSNQAAVTITSASSATYGNAYTATASGGNGTGALVWALGAGSTAAGAAINSSTGVITANGTGSVVINVYRAGDVNYNASATTANFTVTVGQRPITITLSGSKAYNGSTTATGASGAITSGTLAPGDSIAYAYGATSSANVGTYSGLITPTISNVSAPTTRTTSYLISYVGNYSIMTAAQAAVTINSSASATYGNAYTATATGGSGTGALVWALGSGSTATGAGINSSTGVITATSSGTVVIKVYRALDTNYAVSATTADFTVTVGQRPITVTLSGSKAYNGNTATPGAAGAVTSGTLAAGDSIGYSYGPTSSANAAVYGANTPGLFSAAVTNASAPTTRTSSYAITWAGNYTISKANQAAVTITSGVTGTYGVAYTATATGGNGTGALVWALGAGSTAPGAAINSSTGAVSALGAGTVVFKVYRAADTNYNASATTADFTVTNPPIPITVTTTGSKTYNGTTATPGIGASITAGALVGADTIAYAFSATSSANAGSYSVTTATMANVTAPNDRTGNYAITYAGNYTILKANQSGLTINSSASSVYGSPYTATATGGAGTGALTWSLGAGSTATGAAINSSTGVITANSIGTVVVRVYRAGDTNYNASPTTGDFTITITKRPITVTLSGSKVYNGTTVATGAAAAVTTGTLGGSDAISFAYAAVPGATSGNYPNIVTATISNATAPTARSSNYTITYAGNYVINWQLTVLASAGGTATGSGVYGPGSFAPINATPNASYAFGAWTGTGVLDRNTALTSVSANTNVTVTANFVTTTGAIDGGTVVFDDAIPPGIPGFQATETTRTATIVNNGNSNLVVSTVSETGDFTSNAAVPITLTPGQTLDIISTFAPSAVALCTGTLTITSNDLPRRVIQYTLQGYGRDPRNPPISTITADNPTVYAGSPILVALASSDVGGTMTTQQIDYQVPGSSVWVTGTVGSGSAWSGVASLKHTLGFSIPGASNSSPGVWNFRGSATNPFGTAYSGTISVTVVAAPAKAAATNYSVGPSDLNTFMHPKVNSNVAANSGYDVNGTSLSEWFDNVSNVSHGADAKTIGAIYSFSTLNTAALRVGAGPVGANALEFGNTTSNVGLEHLTHGVRFYNGQSYVFGFWARTLSGTRNIDVAISDDKNIGVTASTFTIGTTWTWVWVAKTFTSAGTSPRLFYCYSQAGVAFQIANPTVVRGVPTNYQSTDGRDLVFIYAPFGTVSPP